MEDPRRGLAALQGIRYLGGIQRLLRKPLSQRAWRHGQSLVIPVQRGGVPPQVPVPLGIIIPGAEPVALTIPGSIPLLLHGTQLEIDPLVVHRGGGVLHHVTGDGHVPEVSHLFQGAAGVGLRGADQPPVGLVHHIHQVGESTGLVVVVRRQLWNSGEYHSGETRRQLVEILRIQRRLTQLPKREHRDAGCCSGALEGAAPGDGQHLLPRLLPRTILLKNRLSLSLRPVPQGVEPALHRPPRLPVTLGRSSEGPVVLPGQLPHQHMALHEVQKFRQVDLPVDALVVELLWRSVRGQND
mmetsp:Transcript_4680/g.11073  ORF Transcript_4680/g.11073 Transcript_4680/m.11073 type:complete len:298 (-) Transcript_4680:279-1172(-)